MKIVFLGVGEACDPDQPNTSLVVETSEPGSCQILLDCGFTTPHRYFALFSDPEQLAGVWISHFHGDHFFGLPLLQLRLAEMQRRRPLLILGQAGIAQKSAAALELAYPGVKHRLSYQLDFLELEPGSEMEALGCLWATAANEHSQRALSVRLSHNGRSFLYSGDGRPTPASRELAKGCDLLVHEAYRLEGHTPGHGSVRNCLALARETKVAALALVHLAREERYRESRLKQLLGEDPGVHAFLPASGDSMVL